MRYLRATIALGAASLTGFASAVLVAEGSHCGTQCGNVLDATYKEDVVCAEADYTSGAGVVYQNCVLCEAGSTYTTDEDVESDLQAMLYNLRYTIDFCLFSEDGTNGALGNNPCMTETACGILKDSIQIDDMATNSSTYSYCSYWDLEAQESCTQCLRTVDNGFYLANFFDTLGGGCDFQVPAGSTLSFDGEIFSHDDLNITAPTPTAGSGDYGPQGPLNTGEIAGIVFGGLAAILIVAGCGVVCVGKKRRKAYLRRREANLRNNHHNNPHANNHGQQWPSPPQGDSMFQTMSHTSNTIATPVSASTSTPMRDWGDTPVSQRPLRAAWADSPVSAHTDTTFPRYFSPYSSQYNSPVSAAEAVNVRNWAWPQEKTINIGMALSPTDQEREMQQQWQLQHQQQWPGDVKGKGAEMSGAMVHDPGYAGEQEQHQQHRQHEAYEMQEGVHGHYTQQQQQQQQQQYEQYQLQQQYQQQFQQYQQNQTPVLNHPGYGRTGHTPPQSSG